MKLNNTKSRLIILWRHLSKRRHKQFYALVFLMIIASFAEILSVGAVIPFLGVLTGPEQVYQSPIMQPLIQILGLTGADQLKLPLTIIFILAAIFAGTIRITLLYVMTRLSFAAGADISIDIYRRTLYQEYSVHVGRNSSEVINGIITKTGTVIGGVITPILTIISSTILLVGILSVLFAISISVAFTALIGFGSLYYCVIIYTRSQLKKNSQVIASQSTQMIKSLQEGLGGIRDVLIDGSQQFYCSLYRNADLPLRRASGNNAFITGSPRFAMEAIGMTLIAGLAYVTTQQTSALTAVPVLGALALGAQRLLPVMQQAYSSYSIFKGVSSSFHDVLNLLEQPLPSNTEITSKILFKEGIHINNLSFRYSESSVWILKNINLKITRGDRVGFIGATGSGKSTLLDIFMGLLPATSGSIAVDGQSITNENRRGWQAHIAHVPQHIYLSDSTIEENIAFGVSKENISFQQVKKAAKQAKIAELIESWDDGYQTFVGEQGIRLSGGQRQRIGIARALYKRADVLIFDEATNALDSATEREVMNSIEDLEKEITILIIAHRLTTLKKCNQIVKLDKNSISNIDYEEITE